MPRHAQVEDIPGRGADGPFDHQRDSQAVQPQTHAQPQQAFGQAAGLQLRERAEIGESGGRGERFHGATIVAIGSF
ncbi:hypothetical protein FQZ97_1253280 [compost metagenome]